MFFRCLLFPFVWVAMLAGGLADVTSFSVAGVGGSEKVEFFYRKPAGVPSGVLLLVPGYNGSGSAMFDERWSRFADEHGLVLLAPTFQTSPEQLKKEKGYYYPEQGSGGRWSMRWRRSEGNWA
ncbi:MAG: hypothetical protein WCI20_10045 [bacterium]